MRPVELVDEIFQGAVSIERGAGWVQPWRLPYRLLALFPPDGLEGRGAVPAGVRLCFRSDADRVEIEVEPSAESLAFDCVIDDELVASSALPPGERRVAFSELPRREKRIEIYLSQCAPVRIVSLRVPDGASLEIPEDPRPRWIAYGSSITQCKHAASPAQTWPALVARRRGYNLMCLGFGSNCHLDPEVARMIRDLPAERISMCVGTNICGMASLSPRTFAPALIGFIRTIREGHATTPIVVMSPIINPPRESTPNAVGFTLAAMREVIAATVATLRGLGDENLHYVDGLRVFGPDHAAYLEFGAHPGPEGYRILAANFEACLPEGF